MRSRHVTAAAAALAFVLILVTAPASVSAVHTVKLHHATLHAGAPTYAGDGSVPGAYMAIPARGAAETVYTRLVKTFGARGVRIIPAHAVGEEPGFAFHAPTGQEAMGNVRAWPEVTWVGRLRPEVKIHPNMGQPLYDRHRWRVDTLVPVTQALLDSVRALLQRLAPDVPVGSGASAGVDATTSVQAINDGAFMVYARTGRLGDIDIPLALAGLDYVYSVSCVAWLAHMATTDFTPVATSGPQTSARAIRGSTPNYSGAGVVVGVIDTGLDHGHPYFRDMNSQVPIHIDPARPRTDTGHAHVRAYVPFMDVLFDSSGLDHGTHVSGIVKSVAPDARIAFFDVSCATHGGCVCPTAIEPDCACAHYAGGRCPNAPGSVHAPASLITAFDMLREAGATIINISLGAHMSIHSPRVHYSPVSREIDEYLYAHRELLVVFAAGNNGAAGPRAMDEFNTAKSVVSVGSGGNDTVAPWFRRGGAVLTLDDVDGATSRGPTAEGDDRIKPEVVAPGAWVLSARAGTKLEMPSRGSSMAAPGVAGAAAVLTEFLRERHRVAAPRASLLRAVLVACAVPMTGLVAADTPRLEAPHVPPEAQGFGRVDIAALVDDRRPPPAATLTVLANEDRSLRPGTSAQYEWRASRSRATIVLAWTDMPGSEHAIRAIVNDLDLVVTPVDGGGGASIFGNGGTRRDSSNVVERVELQELRAGARYTISVQFTAGVVAQDFSLVVVEGPPTKKQQQQQQQPTQALTTTTAATPRTTSSKPSPNLFLWIGIPVGIVLFIGTLVTIVVCFVWHNNSAVMKRTH